MIPTHFCIQCGDHRPGEEVSPCPYCATFFCGGAITHAAPVSCGNEHVQRQHPQVWERWLFEGSSYRQRQGPNGTWRCNGCLKFLPEESFRKISPRKGTWWLSSDCKPCYNAKQQRKRRREA